ncbi:MAG: hypothetical protein ACRDV1_12970 [Actinomycetes bacterium]
MMFVGLLLILAGAAVTVGAVYDGGDPATVEVLGRSVETTVAGVFFTGAATMLVFLLGVWLLTASMGRSRRKRAERKEVRSRQRDSVSRLEDERTSLRAENERLAEELASQRRPAGAGAGAGTGAAGARGSDARAGDRTATDDRGGTTHTEHRVVGHDSTQPIGANGGGARGDQPDGDPLTDGGQHRQRETH